MTHYIPYFTALHRGLKTAVCGAHVFLADHAVTPRCPVCAAWLDADDTETKAILKKWAADDAAKAVR